jgi:acetyltransferase
MSSYGLDHLFRPASVAIVGASDRPGSVGRAVVDNLADSGFAGDVVLVNKNRATVRGRAAPPSLRDVRSAADLVVIASPPDSVVDVVQAAAETGARAAVILTAGLTRGPGSQSEQIASITRAKGLRLLGPNAFGLLSPHAGLNASFASRSAKAGDLALVTQSGAVAAALVEWAGRRELGFSAVVSLGDAIDVDVPDCLDHFALDPRTRAILLYLEHVADAAKFMAAARAASQTKPVVVVKGGRHAAGARAAATHTGALAGADDVYDAAFRRAGLLRVLDLDQLFVAAEALGRRQWDRGDRLVILTNGGGLGVLAADRLSDEQGVLAELAPETVAALDGVLPKTWSRGNPVDIIGDAGPARFAAALEILLAAREVDAALVLHAATGLASSLDAARAVVETTRAAAFKRAPAKPVLASWLGAGADAQALFAAAGLPRFDTERDAVAGFSYLTRRRKLEQLLLATPASSEHAARDRRDRTRGIVEAALADGRSWLDPVEASEALTAFGIPMAESVRAASPEEAAAVAGILLSRHEQVALKIASKAITHKSDVGGVCLGLASPDDVARAAADMLKRVATARPDVVDATFILQPMVRRPDARELIAGVAHDPIFGPVLLFGRGGVGVEVYDDKSVGLPPLDRTLAADMIDRTEVARTLAAYRNVQAADRAAVEAILVALAELAEIPEIDAIDLNPLLVDQNGAIAVDARVSIARRTEARRSLAIRPYPIDWERSITSRDGRLFLARPIRAEDEELIRAFLGRVSSDDLRMRFFAAVRHVDHGFLSRLVHIDYGRAMAFAAIDPETGEAAGVVRIHCDPDHVSGEYAVLVRSDLKGVGLGWSLMTLMLEWARAGGLKTVFGEVLRSNAPMLDMCRALGFSVSGEDCGEAVRVSLDLERSEPQTRMTA